MKPYALLIAGLAALTAGFAPQDPKAKAPRVVILHTNDLHGQVYPSRDKGGLAALAWQLKKIRAEETQKGARVFIVDCGDFFQGTPEGDLTEGKIIVDAYNEIGYDALCVGNHDFDLGPPVLEALAKRAKFKFLGANVYDTSGQVPDYLASKVVYTDAQLEMIGITTSDMPVLTVERARVGLTFPLEKEILAKLLPECRTRVVVLSHLGHEREMELARANAVQAWIGGHSHRKMRETCGSTPYCQAGSRGDTIGVVEIAETTTTRFVDVLPKNGEDPKVKEILQHYAPEIGKIMDEVIGELEQDVKREGGGSSLLGNWLCDLMREATKAEIAFHNRTGIRANLQKGKVRLRDLYQVSPFKNTLVTMKLKGKDILELLAHALSHSKYFLEVSGIEFKRDLSSVKVGGYPIDVDREYVVVTNSFLAKGGDSHLAFTRGKDEKDTLVDLLDLHKEAVRKGSPVKLAFEERVK